MLKQFMGNFTKLLISIIITLILFTLLGSFMLNHAHKINNAAILVRNHHVSFAIWRYFVMTIFIYFYPKLIRYFEPKHENITEEQKSRIIKFSRRRYAILFCIFYELMIVHNVLALLINGLLSL